MSLTLRALLLSGLSLGTINLSSNSSWIARFLVVDGISGAIARESVTTSLPRLSS